ncbi:hypothetical protein EDD36DRAFT_459782 [Exophiala viscosa]|uniref:Uncharacterized protein n=1 Tax=Exophiala viscosa TaxID=2486360 RepID=A0AAN6IHC7_9EURO|nr:hypothetical protein EDD36DRAFT_459782 [Exophiala viscosa]
MDTPAKYTHGPQNLAIGSSSAFNNFLKVLKPYGLSTPRYVVFPILSAIFTYYLWIVMGLNGAGDELQATLAAGKYADGTPLCASYTGVRPLDQLITVIVAFEYPVTNGQDKPSWLLMLDIMSTLQTAMIWVFLDSMRKGRSTAWFAYPALWCCTVNAAGAAVILPLYFWLHLQHRPSEQYIQLWDASPLPTAFLIGGVLPGLALVTRTLWQLSAIHHQQIIAFVQFSPLLIATIQIVGSSLYPIRNLDIRRRRTAALPSIQRVLQFGVIFSGLAHLAILGHAAFGAAKLSSIYVPDGNAPLSASAADKILEGAKYFLQWDLIGIIVSTGLWCFYMVSELSDINQIQLAVRLIGGMVLFGPGATTSAVLSWREGHNVAQAEAKRHSRLV